VVGDDSRPSGATVAQGVRAATEAVLAFGATVGDKTMVDALVPFDQVLRTRLDAGAALAEAWGDAVRAAREAADATESLVPKMGRARTHADQAVGTADPGALSFALVVETVGP
jgi:hypothetical protein